MAVNASTIAPASRTAVRLVRFLALRPQGRFLFVSVVAAVLIATLARDEAVDALGMGLIPAGLWGAWHLRGVVSSPAASARRWRFAAASLAASAAIVGVLGMIDRPEATVFEEISLGGSVGVAISRAPAEWEFDGPTGLQQLGGAVRIAAIFVLAAAIMWTRRAEIMARAAWAASVVAYKWSARTYEALRVRAEDYLDRRRKRRAAAAEARALEVSAAPTEAELLENPSYRVGRGEPQVHGVVLEDDGEAVELPAPPEDALWTQEEQKAVATLLAAAEAAVDGVAPDDVLEADDEPAEGEAGVLAEAPSFEWPLPAMDLLRKGTSGGVTRAEIEATSDLIVGTLREHGIDVSVDQVRTGPTVTMYGLAPGWGGIRATDDEDHGARGGKRVRVDTILAREKDLALALASPNIRFEAPIPGASLVGIEVPNSNPSTVTLRSAMETDAFREFEGEAGLPIALGIGTVGEMVSADLTKMPHLLVAGATGSGKSVCINSIITGLVLTRTPSQLRLVLIDPKRVELTPYTGMPHLACPPAVDGDQAVAVLKAAVAEMMQRFESLEQAGVKNIVAYNERAPRPMPYLVIAVDELADLMLNAANEVERLLVRLAQLGRATGIHLVVATQRPSVDVVTGLIKANFPSRISFSVSSQIDSRTIIDSPGAEKLLGKGDMLFLPVDRAKPMRVQGAFLSDTEVDAVVDSWRSAGGPAMPELVIPKSSSATDEAGVDGRIGGGDELFNQALELAHTQNRLSTSLLQRRLRIGYPRAARLMDELEDAGVVGPGEPGKPRVVIGS